MEVAAKKEKLVANASVAGRKSEFWKKILEKEPKVKDEPIAQVTVKRLPMGQLDSIKEAIIAFDKVSDNRTVVEEMLDFLVKERKNISAEDIAEVLATAHYDWQGPVVLGSVWPGVSLRAFRLFLTLPEELQTEKLWKESYDGLAFAMAADYGDENYSDTAFRQFDALPEKRKADFLKEALTTSRYWATNLWTTCEDRIIAKLGELSQNYYDNALVDATIAKLLEKGQKNAMGFIRMLPAEKLNDEYRQMRVEAEWLDSASRFTKDAAWDIENHVLKVSGGVSAKDISRFGIDMLEITCGDKAVSMGWPDGYFSSRLAARFINKLLKAESGAMLRWEIGSKKCTLAVPEFEMESLVGKAAAKAMSGRLGKSFHKLLKGVKVKTADTFDRVMMTFFSGIAGACGGMMLGMIGSMIFGAHGQGLDLFLVIPAGSGALLGMSYPVVLLSGWFAKLKSAFDFTGFRLLTEQKNKGDTESA